MKGFQGKSASSENNFQKQNFNTALSTIMPFLVGLNGNNDGMKNLLGLFSSFNGNANSEFNKDNPNDFNGNTRTDDRNNTFSHSMNYSDYTAYESQSNNFHQTAKPQENYDLISFAGDEVVYFLRKMRMLLPK